MSKITREHLINLTGMVGVEITYLDALLAEAHLEGELAAIRKNNEESQSMLDKLRVGK